MLHFVIAYKDATSKDVYLPEIGSLKSITKEQVAFICKKENRRYYGYGDIPTFVFCDVEGNESPYDVGGCRILSFVTRGYQRDYMLAWTIEHSGVTEEYILHRDDRWYVRSNFDVEWNHPIKDTLRLIRDIRYFGYETRKEIDTLKRELYKKDCEIELLARRYELNRNFDIDLSGTPLEGININPSHGLFDYNKRIKEKNLLAQQIPPFLRHEIKMREITAEQMESFNEEFLKIVSSRTDFRLKDGVTSVHQYQFDYCSKVETIVLPPSVREIVCTAFNFLTTLKSVYILSDEKAIIAAPPPGSGAGYFRSSANFYVPKELLEAYKSDMFWALAEGRLFSIEDNKLQLLKQ